jgi:hypothetical protein
MKREITIIPQVPKNSPETDILSIYPQSDEPLNAALLRWQQQPAVHGAFTQDIRLQRPWLQPPSPIDLSAEYRFVRDGNKVAIHGGFASQLVPLDQPVLLGPVSIDKPWGKEIWFTGMESRGESTVVGDQGSITLSNYLALAPDRLCRRRPMVLLKILAPNPQPVSGDLYCEVHDEKREVYVVTDVDDVAWPDGTGAIRFGVNQQRRAEFPNDAAFRAGYLEAVKAYESVRRAIDTGQKVEPALEASTRQAMECFTSLQPLAVGDVAVVPTWVPHSLQHGVRVVEFQTPSFERFIISFAQQVLTQDHWDSDHAIANLHLERPENPTFTEVAPGLTQIIKFDDFTVWRLELDAGASCQPPLSIPYAVCMNVSGGVSVAGGGSVASGGSVAGQALAPEQACLVPHAALPFTMHNASMQRSVSLIAAATW